MKQFTSYELNWKEISPFEKRDFSELKSLAQRYSPDGADTKGGNTHVFRIFESNDRVNRRSVER